MQERCPAHGAVEFAVEIQTQPNGMLGRLHIVEPGAVVVGIELVDELWPEGLPLTGCTHAPEQTQPHVTWFVVVLVVWTVVDVVLGTGSFGQLYTCPSSAHPRSKFPQMCPRMHERMVLVLMVLVVMDVVVWTVVVEVVEVLVV